jgi:hypothetical protein
VFSSPASWFRSIGIDGIGQRLPDLPPDDPPLDRPEDDLPEDPLLDPPTEDPLFPLLRGAE